jgi:S1-C subfamily serine protease
MSSRGDRRLPLVILMGAMAWTTLPALTRDATAQGYEPPGAPRMPAGGTHSDPGGSVAGGSVTGTTTSPEQAVKDLIAAAKAGDSESQRKLGLALLAIKPPKTDEAYKLLNQSADRGNTAAMVNIGQMFAGGVGVVKNEALALTWYRRAADKGNAEGQNALGRLYETGQGVPQDFAEALKWYRLAADQNNASGQNNLGNLYATGHGVPTDPVEAVRLFRLSADQGNAFAQANLGFRYASGVGIAPSPAASYFWLNLATARLPSNMTPLRDQVARARDAAAAKVAPAELTRMQQMAGVWKPGSTDVPTGTETAGAPGRVQTAGVAVPAAPVAPGAPRNSGTGFVISQSGFVLTNNHVAGACNEVRARHGADELGKLSVVAKDVQNDLALLKLPSRFPDAAVFREDRGLRQGDNVVTYGFPLTNVLAVQGNLTTGTISALSGLASDSRMLQISAPVQPGNSGGPLLDGGGNVIGVVSMKLNALRTAAATGDIPQNVNFAIKAGVARGFLDANGVDYRITAETRELKTADVGDRAKKFTLFIECLR